MKYLLIYIGLLCTSLQLWGQETVATRIAPPTGYVREACSDHSFTGYLRNLPLMPKGSKVMLYNGKEKSNQSAAYAVIDMEIGNRDLQQCADAVMRLRAEFLWKHKRYGQEMGGGKSDKSQRQSSAMVCCGQRSGLFL